MEEQDNKTIICSVLFLDIMEYSKKSVSGQIALKEGFNAFLSTAIRDVPVDDRIILDTGDGAVISFLGDITDALNVALNMRVSLLSSGASMEPPLLVRMGINLGPVRLVRDINGLPNIVGDGINVAQRVMGFSGAGQILVSRSYYDAVSHLSQDYAGMFHYEGSRTDKHVREHEVYAIGDPGEFTMTEQGLAPGAKRIASIHLLSRVKTYTQITLLRLDFWAKNARAAFYNASRLGRVLIIGVLSVLLVLIIVLVEKIAHRPVETAPLVVMPAQHADIAQSSVAVATAPAKIPVQPVDEAAKQVQVRQEKSHKKSSRIRTLEETTAINAGAPALVSLAITPWGEIYLDGRMQGVSPPLAELQVVPGEHVIEIRNSTFPVYSQKFRVEANGKIKIKHKFSN